MASAWVGDIESPAVQAEPLDRLPERDGKGLTSGHETLRILTRDFE